MRAKLKLDAEGIVHQVEHWFPELALVRALRGTN
jgi:hypothetical protein